MNKKTKNIIDLVINLFILINVALCLYTFFTTGGDGNMIVYKWKCFRFYTVDSNVLCAIACAIMAIENIKIIKDTNKKISNKKLMFKFVSVVAVMVTFLVVVIFLGPTQGYKKMFEDTNIYMHGLNPIFAAISFIVFESGYQFPKSKLIWGDITVLVYALLYFVMVIVLAQWADFYGFATVLKWYVSFPAMILFGYGVSYLVWKLYITNKKTDSEVM